jgi:hypothetical protein
LRQITESSDGENDMSKYETFQVAIMILSLGCTAAVADLKYILQKMRDKERGGMILPTSKDHPMENLVELALWFPDGDPKGDVFDDFRYRTYITRFCDYMVLECNIQMPIEMMGEEESIDTAYTNIIVQLYPKIPHYVKDAKGSQKMETPRFIEKKNALRSRTIDGFHWLPLVEKFGVGILALYHPGHILGDETKISIDHPDVKEWQIDLLHAYLQQDNQESQWLTHICSNINAHIEQGLVGPLVLTQLLVEVFSVEEIKSYKEQSHKLSIMCSIRTDYVQN